MPGRANLAAASPSRTTASPAARLASALPALPHPAPVAPNQLRRLRREAWLSHLARGLDAFDQAALARARQVRALVYGPLPSDEGPGRAEGAPEAQTSDREDWCVVSQAAAPRPNVRSRRLE